MGKSIGKGEIFFAKCRPAMSCSGSLTGWQLQRMSKGHLVATDIQIDIELFLSSPDKVCRHAPEMMSHTLTVESALPETRMLFRSSIPEVSDWCPCSWREKMFSFNVSTIDDNTDFYCVLDSLLPRDLVSGRLQNISFTMTQYWQQALYCLLWHFSESPIDLS